MLPLNREIPDNSPVASEIAGDVYEKLKADYEAGNLDSDMEYYAEYSEKEFQESFNVEDILDAAQFWDNYEAVDWFKKNYPEVAAVKLPYGHYGNDAAVFVRPEIVKKQSISREKYDQSGETGYILKNRLFRKRKY